ncbi:MAG TPA: FAD-dependent monooxygenase, partial [Burkholderiales bacterium]|nr:FAD-dependent monooxygenase [Burkholderiales bacterium]
MIDVLIRGAGPVGCVAALALRGSHEVRLLDRGTATPTFRPIVLSYASRLILERVGVWDALAATTIEKIHVSQAGAFGRTLLDAADAGVPALGYVVEYADLVAILRKRVQALMTAEELPARCAVHAEGMSPDASVKRYAQDALVALVEVSPASHTVAFERFTREGPLALLPFAGRYALVWSLPPEKAARLAAAPEADFLRQLNDAAGTRPGRATGAEARAVQPLALRVRQTRIGERAVYIGNAAQTLHPVAGQGLNLGLRDAWDLAQIMRDAADPGDAAMLERFAVRRRLDAGATIRATDLLAGIFLGAN